MKKVALITGSKGGIGSAISSQLVENGYRLLLLITREIINVR